MTTPGTVIIVDDIDEMRDIVRRVLRTSCPTLSIVTAANGHQALAMLESLWSLGVDGGPVLVITDVRMPGIDGLMLATSIRSSPFPTKTILMSGFMDEHLRDRATELGALACFEKPFDLKDLARVVMRVFQDERKLAKAV